MRAVKRNPAVVLELTGVVLLVVFAGLVWWPAAVGVAGAACIVLAWALEQQPAKGQKPDGDGTGVA